MGVFARFRETADADTANDPLMIERAADTYRALQAEVRASRARHDEIVGRLQADAVNRERVKFADAGDYEGLVAFDRGLEELRVEAQVRQRHQPVLESKVRRAADHLNELQRRKIEIEQATAVAELGAHVPALRAAVEEALVSVAPYDEALGNVWGSSQCSLVRLLIELRNHLDSEDRGGWIPLAAAAQAILDGEPDHEAIVAYNEVRQGRPATYTGIFA